MGIESYLGNGDKLTALTELRSLIAKEIYIACLRCNIEPETFDCAEYLQEVDLNPSINFGQERTLLFDLSKKFTLIQQKIESM